MSDFMFITIVKIIAHNSSHPFFVSLISHTFTSFFFAFHMRIFLHFSSNSWLDSSSVNVISKMWVWHFDSQRTSIKTWITALVIIDMQNLQTFLYYNLNPFRYYESVERNVENAMEFIQQPWQAKTVSILIRSDFSNNSSKAIKNAIKYFDLSE